MAKRPNLAIIHYFALEAKPFRNLEFWACMQCREFTSLQKRADGIFLWVANFWYFLAKTCFGQNFLRCCTMNPCILEIQLLTHCNRSHWACFLKISSRCNSMFSRYIDFNIFFLPKFRQKIPNFKFYALFHHNGGGWSKMDLFIRKNGEWSTNGVNFVSLRPIYTWQ